MKIAILIIIGLASYLFIGFIAWVSYCLWARIEGFSADHVYGDGDMAFFCIVMWPIYLPCGLIYFILKTFRIAK